MFKRKFKVWQWLLALALVTVATSGCIWFGPRGRAHIGLPIDGAVIIEGGDHGGHDDRGRDGGRDRWDDRH